MNVNDYKIIDVKSEEEDLAYGTEDEAKNLLQNGILVETNKGLICMSLNDALSSNLNLSVEDLQNVAAQLILQQNMSPKVEERIKLEQSFNFDSDGFSSECSDISSTSAPLTQSTYFTLAAYPNKVIKSHNDTEVVVGAKILSIIPAPDKKVEDITNALHSSSEISVNSYISDSDTNVAVSNSQSETSTETKPMEVTKPPKRRGGWPKGRKRKPELLNLPPKAPATGYNLYLNEQRKLFKDTTLAFHEITKIIGNRWSNLSLEEKKPYLAKAEEDKKRYREELTKYRQSDAYRAYLNKKRKHRLQNNILSESDMDATDEIDDEDNEELYCRTCDQWFHNLHNKREHLQGKQHNQSLVGDMRELEFATISNISTNNPGNETTKSPSDAVSVEDSINSLITIVARREKEIKSLQSRLQEAKLTDGALWQQLRSLSEREKKLRNDLAKLKAAEKDMESKVFQLWKVPSLFIMTDFNNDILSEYGPDN